VNLRSGSFAILAVVFSLFTVSCGGGAVNTTPVITPAPGVTAPALPSLTAFSPVSTSAAFAASSAVTLPALTPPAGVDTGTSAVVALPAQSSGGTAGTAQVSMSSSTFAGLPTLASTARSVQGSRSTESEIGSLTGVLFFSFSVFAAPPATSFTFPTLPSYTITLPSAFFSVPQTTYYLALYDATRPSLAWQSRVETCVATASTSTLVCTATGPVTLANNVPYYFALYAVSTAAAAPTPGPSVSPIAAATNAPSSSPSSSGTSITATLTNGAQTIALPAVGGVSGSMSITGSDGAATLTGTVQTAPGNGFAPVSGTPIYSVLFSASRAAHTSTVSGTFTLASVPATGTRFILATYDSRYGWFYGLAGPGTVTGSTVNISSPLTVNLTTGVTYGVALYSLPSTGAATSTANVATGSSITLPAA
jgi:hypothetical protein